MTKKAIHSVFRWGGYLAGVGTAAFLATQYSACTPGPKSPPALTAGSAATGPCTNDTWCRSYARKMCADNTATKCVDGECIYALKISQTPPNLCISGDVQTCSLGGAGGSSGGALGIATCEPISGSGGGCNWGGCGPL